MSYHNLVNPLIVIVGPTAVGKTEISIKLAERFEGEIVSADSRLFYRGMNIGTAKPTLADVSRVPHHLIDVADPDDPWSLSKFQLAASQAIHSIHARDRLPFLVGGTGQYVRSVIEAWQIPPQEPEPLLRIILERWGNSIGAEALHHRLKVLDPQSAELIDWRNMRRSIRALEVILRTGRRFSEQRLRSSSPYSLLMIGLRRSRDDLYRRVDSRIETMFQQGFVEEVKLLLDKGYSPDLPTLSAIGYREVIAYLQGKMTMEEAVTQIKRLTRRFVRHQGAWFNKSDNRIHWFDVNAGSVDEIDTFIRAGEGWILPEG